MTTERFGIYKVGGKDATVIGEDIKVGKIAPDLGPDFPDVDPSAQVTGGKYAEEK